MSSVGQPAKAFVEPLYTTKWANLGYNQLMNCTYAQAGR